MTAKSKGKAAAGRRDDDDDIEEFDDEYGKTPLSRSSSRRVVVSKTVKAAGGTGVNHKNNQTKKATTPSGNLVVKKKKSPAAATASSSTTKTTIPSSNKPPVKPPARNGSFRSSSLPGNTKQQSQRSLGVSKSSHRPTTLSRASSTRSCNNNRSSSSPSLKTQKSERSVTSKSKGLFEKLQDEIEFVDDPDNYNNTSNTTRNNYNNKGKAPPSTCSVPVGGGVSTRTNSGNISCGGFGSGGGGVSRTNSVRSMKSQKSQRSVTSSVSRTNSTRSIVDKFQDEFEFVDDPDDYNTSAATPNNNNNNNKRKAPPSTRSLPAGLSRINSSSRNVSGGRGGSGGGSVVSGVSRTNSVRSMKSQKSQRSLTSTLSRSNSTRSMQTQKNKKSYIRIIDDGGSNDSNHDHHLSRSKSQRSMTSHTSRTSITTSQRHSTTSSFSSSRRKKTREEHLKDLLGQGSYHLPGHSWCQDWLQYFGNNHPLFCVFFQHPLHPVSRCIKAVQLVGSIMVGLVITNVIYLLLIYDKHDDLIDLPKAGGGGDTGNTTTTSWKLLETQEEQSELIKEYTEIQLDPGMWVLWTVGGAIHAIWDNTVWYATACSCFDSELLWVRRFKQTCNFLVVVFVIALIAAGTLAVLIRAHVEGGGELDAAMLTAKASDNSQAIMDVQNYEFMMSYAVELAVAWFLWFPIIETILFSGVLGFCCPCCISCLGGRPAEVKAEEEEADLERGRSMRFM